MEAIFPVRTSDSFRHWLVVLAVVFMTAVPAWATEVVRVAILAFRSEDRTNIQWQSIAARANAVQSEFRYVIEPMGFDALNSTIQTRQADFVLTNPAHYLMLSRRFGLSAPLATLEINDHGRALTAFGGVIFTRSDRTDIHTLKDLKGQIVAAVDRQSLGGYQAQAYEMQLAGLPLPDNDHLILTGMPHDRVVSAVLNGNAAAGFVRSGVIEGLVAEGKIDASRIRVINTPPFAGFPFQISTRLYPEWALASLPHVSRETSRRVLMVLFGLDAEFAARPELGVHGFAIPANYAVVENLLQGLRLPPFDEIPGLRWQDFWLQYRLAIILSAAFSAIVIAILTMLTAVTVRLRQTQQRLFDERKELLESRKLYRALFDNSPVPMLVFDEATMHVVMVNQRAVDHYGYSQAEFQALTIQDIRPPEDAANAATLAGETRHRKRNGDIIDVVVRTESATYEGRAARVVMVEDITERKRREELIRHQANFDALTDLPNRHLLSDRLGLALAAARRANLCVGVLFLDLDKFKPINDTLGHETGDRVLREVAQRLRQCVRDSDTVARLGGDEFVILAPALDSKTDACNIATKVRRVFQPSFELDGHNLQIGCSIGIAVYPDHGADERALLNSADIAMYHAKTHEGYEGVCLFDAELAHAPGQQRLPSPHG